ncbi:MAG: Txe/YoeB family addiction module toxin [Gallionella sp.]|nr:Txe/YoeB family addiction module toxin [Gallionella sp.]MDD4957779.1 Txe/YoeB family addiction module toxin [Gallionella sp.]
MARLLTFTPAAWADYVDWQGQDQKTLRRINSLITASLDDPFNGIGKPESLRNDLSGFCSRRIDETNRLVYQATDSELMVIACWFYYDG